MLLKTYHRLLSRLYQYILNRYVAGLFIAILVGVLGGYGAVLFRFVIKAGQYAFYQNAGDILTFEQTLPGYAKLGLPALGGLIVGLIISIGGREAKGHGVPEVMEAITLRAGRMRKRVGLVKIMASAVCIGSGGSVGREGPIVQIGSSIGSTIGQIFKFSTLRQRTLVGCGAAAGIAATFNAPIAGVLFALEVLLGDFGIASFSPVVLSSVTATAISRHYFGDFPAFVIPAYEVASVWEFLLYGFLGLFAGLVALLFIIVLYRAEDFFDALEIREWLKPALGGFMIGLLLLKWPHVFGVGYGTINLSLVNEIPGYMLLVLIFAKLAATSITLGSGGSGGIFAPSLFIGAMAGGSFGCLANIMFPGLTASPGAYALVGMGAVVAGTTRAPITAILIIFEMTGNYAIILPMMITCILSNIVVSSLKEGSIYTIKLLRKGLDISEGMEQNILRDLKVKQFMHPVVNPVPGEMTLKDLIHTFKTRNVSYLHVVNQESELIGIISFRDIRGLLGEEEQHHDLTAEDVATKDMAVITPEDNMQTALSLMSGRGISQLPVVSSTSRKKVIATLREKDVVAAYDKAVLRHEIEAA